MPSHTSVSLLSPNASAQMQMSTNNQAINHRRFTGTIFSPHMYVLPRSLYFPMPTP